MRPHTGVGLLDISSDLEPTEGYAVAHKAGTDAMRLPRCTSNLEELRSVDIVIEAIVESEDVKKRPFVELDKITKPSAIFPSNTSSISIIRLASATNRQRQYGFQFRSKLDLFG
ncbi:uncharacterized protein LOC116124963 [Pistacia vera]|uniref:uncharacterized protein LOC116124963 n=1 Tax=Pistacia vera TaxID=55513 RepID=UPI001263417F|nr:uncharacterized protein LOC116124963 [Pistacia vera]